MRAVDWDRPDWGNHFTEASFGSWLEPSEVND